MRKEDRLKEALEGCADVCKKAGESLENCLPACSTAVKKFYSEKTKLSVGTGTFQTNIETENNLNGRLLITIFVIIAALLIISLL